jgi:hypothetical protein
MSSFQIIKVHVPTANQKVLQVVNTRSEAEQLRNRYLANLTPQELQSGYLIQIIPSSN